MARLIHIDAHTAALSQHFTVSLPEGAGPHPVVILLHGCGGLQPLQHLYARTAVEAGVATLVVDSFAHRGISRTAAQMAVCTGMRLRGAERSADLFAALHWLHGQAWADCDRVAAAGWSHGAWTVMDALAGGYGRTGLQEGRPERLERLRAAFLVYPYAGPTSLTAAYGWGPHRPRVWAVLGAKDAVVGERAPRRALERVKREGVSVDIHTFEGATHGFDDPDSTDPRTRYDPALTARSQALFREAMETALTREGTRTAADH